MSKYTFEVNPETFEVTAFVEGQQDPFIYQPDQADGTAWESVEQATAWIEALIAELEASQVIPEGAVAVEEVPVTPAEEPTPAE